MSWKDEVASLLRGVESVIVVEKLFHIHLLFFSPESVMKYPKLKSLISFSILWVSRTFLTVSSMIILISSAGEW